MKLFFAILLFLVLQTSQIIISQNNALVINNNAYVVINGGTVANPAHIVINQPHANGIITTGTGGNLVSENEYNYVKWNVSNSTGTYVIPYTTAAPVVTKIPLTVSITSPGSVGGHFLHSTYRTDDMNNPWASSVNHMFDANTGTIDNSLFVVDRFWIIDAMNYGTRPDVNMTFGYVNNALELGAPNTIIVGNLGAQRFNSSNSHWEGIISFGVPSGIFGTDNGPGVPTVSNVVMAGTDLYRTWTLSDKSSPLPVALLSFESECTTQGNVITWQTAAESNNDYFEVLRSDNGIDFISIAQIPGNGTVNSINNYTYIDEIPATAYTFYKLMQYDYDGTAQQIGVKHSLPCSSSDNIHIYNGLANEIIIDYTSIFDDELAILLYDAAGRLIDDFGKRSVVEGTQQIKLQHSAIAFGSYFIVVKSATEKYNKQLILN
jgi:hypothetical protein